VFNKISFIHEFIPFIHVHFLLLPPPTYTTLKVVLCHVFQADDEELPPLPSQPPPDAPHKDDKTLNVEEV